MDFCGGADSRARGNPGQLVAISDVWVWIPAFAGTSGPRLFQRRDNGPEAHFLGEAMCGLHLLLVEHSSERPRGNREAMNAGAVERDRHDALADAADQAIVRVTRLTAGQFTQRGLDRRPIRFLRRGEVQRALDARDVNRRGLRRVGAFHHVACLRGRNSRQQTQGRERDHARAYSHFHFDWSPTLQVSLGTHLPVKFAVKAYEMRTKCDFSGSYGTI